MSGFVIDRREEHKDKSPTSRDRFIKRYKEIIKKAAADTVQKAKGFRDLTTGKEGKEHAITIDRKTLDEPVFTHGKGGDHEFILSGNDRWTVGDTLPKPPPNGGGGGREGSPDGEGEDDFTFYLDREEFLRLILDDLALPEMVKKNLAYSVISEYVHAGYTKTGSPGNMDVMRSFKQSLSRRIGLQRNAKKAKLRALEKQLAELDPSECDEISRLEVVIAALKAKLRANPYIDPNHDLRYRHRELEKKPSVSAVMFCVDGDTEYLSEIGWKKIRDYKDCTVAQYTPDGRMEFVFPNGFIKNDYDGDFIRIEAQGINQCLTPEHRVIYRTEAGNLREITAHELEDRHNSSVFGFRGKFITHFNYNGPGLDLSHDEIRFHVAFKADGTYQTDHTNRGQFSFKKARKIDRLLTILSRLGWDFSITEREDRTWVYVTTPTRIDKRYGSDWYKVSAEQVAIISEEVLHWDGYTERETFSSKYKSDTDFIQFVWAASGYGTNVFESSNVWVVSRCSYSERSLSSKEPNRIVREPLNCKHSYCFAVPSGMLVLRRDNNIFVTGNCLMDVSGSMTENLKMNSKYFFMLLHLFLKKSYKNVDVVFIRHTTTADEVDEETFFYDRETGGTLVSSALDKCYDIIKARYDPAIWNIYVAQASDGDNYSADSPRCKETLETKLLQLAQYMVYVEMSDNAMNHYQQHGYSNKSSSDLWRCYEQVADRFKNLQMKTVGSKAEIYPVFRNLFEKKQRE